MKKKHFLTATLLLSMLWILAIPTYAADIQTKEQSASVESQQGFLFANGVPLLIVATEPGYGKLYIDSNRDAQVSDGEEEITTLDTSHPYDTEKGFYLAETNVYGGCLFHDFTGDTYVALTGPYAGFQDTSGNAVPGGTIAALYGGSYGNGTTLTGNTQIVIAGGKVAGWIFGGGTISSLEGNTDITIINGIVAGNLCGGGLNGAVSYKTAVTISGGEINGWIYGGGYNSDVGDDTHVKITGGTVGGDVFGGCNRGGTVKGDTNVTLGGTAQVNGNVLGGGGGYENALVTVEGNTHVTLKDSAVIGVQGGGILYGGGAECSIVKRKVFMEITGGTVNTIVPGGNWTSDSSETGTGDASVTMTGGHVTSFGNWGYDSSSPVGSLILKVSGADFNGTNFNIGCDTAGAALGDVSVTIDSCEIDGLQFQSAITGDLSVTFQNATAERLYLNSPVEGNVDISFQASQSKDFYLATNVLNPNADSRLTFLECGSSTGKWGSSPSLYTTLNGAENPVLYGTRMNGNQFKTIEVKDCYISMVGESGQPDDTSPASYGSKLTVDGGVLRLCGLSRIYMPETTFIHDPLLLNSLDSSGNGSPLRFDTVPAGTARLQWLAHDGDRNPEVTCDSGIVEAPSEAAATIFSSGTDSYVLKTENVTVSGDGTTWTGKGWFSGSPDRWCTCNIPAPYFEKYTFPIPQTQDSLSIVLRELDEGATDRASNCPVVGHKGQPLAVTYALTENYTMADVSIDDENHLTVSGTGQVDVTVSKSLNGKNVSDTVRFYFIGVPSESEYENVYQAAEDILLEFDVKGIDITSATVNNSYIYNNTLHKPASFQAELQGDKLILMLPKDYMNDLEKADYDMNARIELKNGRSMDYSFTLSITDKRTPEGTPRLSADSLIYGNALNTIVLSGDMSYKGVPVKGTFTLVSPEAVPEVPADGIYPLAWTFTPENTGMYLEVAGTSDLVIHPRQVTLSWRGADTRTYNGTPSNVTASAGNLVGQDELTVIVTGGDRTDAGTHTAVAMRLTGEKAGNYALPSSASVDYIITPAAGIASVTMEGWTYSPDNAGRKEPVPVSSTNGTEHVTFLYKPKGAPNTAYEDILPSDAGEYTLKAVFAATENYAETTATTDFVITRAPKPNKLPDSSAILPPSAGQADSLKDLTPPEGWKWKDETLELVPGGSVSAVLVYHDTANYDQYEITILISKLPELIATATDSEYTIGEDRSSTIHCTGALQELTGVMMDGAKVDPANYTLKEGSTILTFSEKYMNQLSLGAHQVTLVYNAGNVNAIINVKERRQNTDSDSNEDEDSSSDETQNGDTTSDAGSDSGKTLSKKRRAPATGEPGQEVETTYDMPYFVPTIVMAAATMMAAGVCLTIALRRKRKSQNPSV